MEFFNIFFGENIFADETSQKTPCIAILDLHIMVDGIRVGVGFMKNYWEVLLGHSIVLASIDRAATGNSGSL